jgi:hypothetical protein
MRFSKGLRPLFFALLLGSCSAQHAFAGDIGCGHDTDRSGAVDNACLGSDADEDGYTVAQGDCDDADPKIWPGTPTVKGAPHAGNWRVCRADGSGYTNTGSDGGWFTSSDPYCPKTSDHTETLAGVSCGACYYYSFSAGDDSRTSLQAQSRTTPWKTMSKFGYYSSGAPAGHYSRVAGDCFINDDDTAQSTTYNSNYAQSGTAALFAARGTNGTSSAYNQLLCYPGRACKWKPASGQKLFWFENSDYWVIRGGDTGSGAVGELSATSTASGAVFNGISVEDLCDHFDISLFYIHDISGTAANNPSGISQSSTSNYVRIHHNYLADNYDRGAVAPPNQNNYNIFNWKGINNRTDHNDIIMASGHGGGIRKKH